MTNTHSPFNLGIKAYEEGEYERATQDYDEAIRLDSELAGAYYSRGVAYERLCKTSEAAWDFQKAKELGYES